MKAFGVVCEFNPFHNGHQFFLNEIKKECDCVVGIMSGNYVQRGSQAVCDKYLRAETAVKNGADIIIELPVPYAVASGGTFARGAVSILAKTGCIDCLCFGAESSIKELEAVFRLSKTDLFQARITDNLSKGLSYPDAFQRSLESENILGSNNILALEYMKYCELYNIPVKAVLRKNAGHDSLIPAENIASASFIRSCIRENKPYTDFVPAPIDNNAVAENISDDMLFAVLRRMTVDDIKNTADVTEGLEHRIYKALNVASSSEELMKLIKTSRYTGAKIRRIILCAYLGITKEMQTKIPSSFYVLASNEEGMEWLNHVKNKGEMKPVIRYSDREKLCCEDKKLFDFTDICDSLYGLCFTPCRNAQYNRTHRFNLIKQSQSI